MEALVLKEDGKRILCEVVGTAPQDPFGLPELGKLTREQLLDLKIHTEDDLRKIRDQLRLQDPARDAGWFRRANSALRMKRGHLQRIAKQLGQMREARKEKNRAEALVRMKPEHQRFLHGFFRAAKAMLPADRYEAICQQAGEWKQSEHPNATVCSICTQS